MKFFKMLAVFIIAWIILFFVVQALWDGPHAVSAGILFGGVMSIASTVLFGLFDEIWLQHGQY